MMDDEKLKNKWKDDYFDKFKEDIIKALNYLKLQFDEGVEYDINYIDKAIIESFPDLYTSDDLNVCACGEKYTIGYSDERSDTQFCCKQCADEHARGDL